MSKSRLSGRCAGRGPAVAGGAVPGRAGRAGDGAGAGGRRRGRRSGFDGVVEAVRQTVVAAQVAGAVTALDVKAGDTRQGRPGAGAHRRPRRRAERQRQRGAGAVGAAPCSTWRARTSSARSSCSRSSTSARPRSSAPSRSSRRRRRRPRRCWRRPARRARSRACYVVRAPYAGVVAEVPVALGDMAMPGRALLDAVRAGGAARHRRGAADARCVQPVQGVRVEFPGLPEAQRWFAPAQVQVLPTVDAATHTVQLRIDLPAGQAGRRAGHVRPRLAAGCAGRPRAGSYVPAAAIVRRAEMTGVYVRRRQGRAAAAPGAPGPRDGRHGRGAVRRVGRRARRARSAGRGPPELRPGHGQDARASPAASPPSSRRRRSRRCWRWWRCCSASSPCSSRRARKSRRST